MKKMLAIVAALFISTTIFAESKEYSAYLNKAKEYEAKKQWAFALDAYYDALNCDDEPQIKEEAYTAYSNIKTAILSGNPGPGKYNVFTMHDEWKRLLIDAEKLGSSICIFDLKVGNLVQGELDYSTRTATYQSIITTDYPNRYNNTIKVIASGYTMAYKSDWTDLIKPENWPLYSVSHSKEGIFNENGVLIYEQDGNYYNAFAAAVAEYKDWRISFYKYLYDFKFNIVDKNGKELVKGKRWLCGTEDGTITFAGITPELMDLIDDGQAFIKLQTAYLEYGHYNKEDDQGGRTFIKNFPEAELSLNKIGVKYGEDNKNSSISNFDKTNIAYTLNDYFVTIPGRTYAIAKTEVTQDLYELITNYNPSNFKNSNLPVENVSWYDAIYFCNKLSVINGKEPVYAVDGKTDVTEWNYLSNKRETIRGTITQNEQADGYRLPTSDEWENAARGGEFSTYSGSVNIDEVAWYDKNSEKKPHAVGEKKSNGYGLYDMSGNVSEWVGDYYDGYSSYGNSHYYRGGSYNDSDTSILSSNYGTTFEQYNYLGFRLSTTLTGDELEKAKQEIAERNSELIQELDNSFINIPGKTYKIENTEVTQSLYKAVMGENPSTFKFDTLPVENVSWYDAIYFCNKLSILKGKEPVYAVNDKTDVTEWNYIPHKEASIEGEITQNLQADGYRLPSYSEWEYAAIGKEFSTYSGSDNIDEVAWYKKNSSEKTHPVAKKKANTYGLYDMSGNVEEWVWDSYNSYDKYRYYKGGRYSNDSDSNCKITYRDYKSEYKQYNYCGFRLCASFTGAELEIAKKEIEERNKIILDKVDDFFIKVPLKTYKIAKTEVTQSLYEAVMGENPSRFKFDNLPVENASWYDAIYFCNKLSILKGKEPVYAVNDKTDVTEWNYIPHNERSLSGTITQNEQADGYRLPSGTEWEYAARGGEYFKYSGSENIDDVAWYGNNSENKTHPAGEKKANGFGLYDMSGNVYEWVWNENNTGYYRGGSYSNNDTYDCDITQSKNTSATYKASYRGFRLSVFLTGDELEIAKQEIEAKNAEILNTVDDSFIQIPGKNYKIAMTEVTQSLYEIVMESNPSNFRFANLPVENVSWYDAIYFCNKLSILKGKEPVYAVDGKTDVTEWNYKPHTRDEIYKTITQNTQANGYRLPIAEEWEYAARGGETFNFSGSDNIDEVAWYDKNSESNPHPVGEKKANGYGLYDMSGNVQEWIWDEKEGYSRGGSWKNDYYSCKVADQESNRSDYSYNYIGFRLLLSSE